MSDKIFREKIFAHYYWIPFGSNSDIFGPDLVAHMFVKRKEILFQKKVFEFGEKDLLSIKEGGVKNHQAKKYLVVRK